MASRLHFVGQVLEVGGERIVRDAFTPSDRADAVVAATEFALGSFVEVWREPGGVRQVCVAAAGSARAALYALVREQGLDPAHPDAVEREALAILADPGIDDATLVDRTELPFVTVDGPGTRDLDQALYVAPDGDGWIAHYAIADAAWYVRPGSALFDEALARGASYYLPGLSIPMLPRNLSEGVISINAGVDRRALSFVMRIGPDGECRGTTFERVRLRSRAKLEFGQVQALLDGADGHGIDDQGVQASLFALRDAGEARLRAAAERDLVRHRHEEIRVKLDDGPDYEFVVISELRDEVERYGEQLSLLCNIEGAHLLREGARDRDLVQPVYRVHAPPEPERMAELVATIDAACAFHGVPQWRWQPEHEPLSAYLERLANEAPGAGAAKSIGDGRDRLARALLRQAVLVNVRSSFSAEPAPHFGIGADVYARFSAPMREVVGVFVHKEAWEALRKAPPSRDDEALRARVIEAANAAKDRQRSLTHGANLLVLDRMFARDAALPPEQRPPRRGTVMGAAPRKLYVRLDEPAVDVKIYGDAFGSDDPAPVVTTTEGREVACALGCAIDVRVRAHDPRGHRWLLEIVG
ncbi:MAG: RNB domain-containing ribonuclease [Deltaproteobacteria bacterium]|nr:RNB domain-containing ribonuclease [Deltaproteobacteria bacterium]MBK8236639.1 RNB domain-containing ribonuclease [Deltaproteobacteria bacterium]MBP7288785.1 RNB domain-containing ribonuclease [Nannocystaceae bacterium]